MIRTDTRFFSHPEIRPLNRHLLNREEYAV